MIRTSTDQIKSCEYLKKNNWIYDPETGIVYSGKGKPWKNPSIRMILKDKSYVIVQKTFYAWFYMLNEIPSGIFIKHKDGDNENNMWNNLTTEYKKRINNREAKAQKPFEQLSKSTQLKYKSFCPERVPEGFVFEKIIRVKKAKKEKKIKFKVERKRRTGNHIFKDEFFMELILSKARGNPSAGLQDMFNDLVIELTKKFEYRSYYDRQDCLQEAFYHLYKNWTKFNEDKYGEDQIFPYFTEIAKRGMVRGYKDLTWHDYYLNESPKLISLVWK